MTQQRLNYGMLLHIHRHKQTDEIDLSWLKQVWRRSSRLTNIIIGPTPVDCYECLIYYI